MSSYDGNKPNSPSICIYIYIDKYALTNVNHNFCIPRLLKFWLWTNVTSPYNLAISLALKVLALD